MGTCPYNTRISAISQSERIRGLRHKQYRPDLIVIDDVEDLESVKTKETRDKLWDWLTGEVIPIGDTNTKIVIVGNLLHEDSLMMRLKQRISSGQMAGVYKEYPLIDSQGRIAWEGKYPTMDHIAAKQKDVADEYAWYREYLLQFISDDRRIVQRSWIHYDSEISMTDRRRIRFIGIGTDLAISEKTTADFTSLVPFVVIGYGDDLKIYILPYIINKRLNFPDTIKEIKKLCDLLQGNFNRVPYVLVENVGYQMAVVQQLKIQRVIAEAVDIKGMSKQTRLEIASPYIRKGNVLFSHKGTENLISQIVNFGIEKHDDLADAFTIAILRILESDRPTSIYKETPTQNHPRMEQNPFTGEWMDRSVPITAGMLDMKF